MNYICYLAFGLISLFGIKLPFDITINPISYAQASLNLGIEPSKNDKNLLLSREPLKSKNSKFSTVIYNKNWDLQSSLNHLKQNAYPKSTGQCARAVRLALQKGGIYIEPVSSAKYLGSSLINKGFIEVPKGSPFIAGDIAVIQPPKGDIHGHSAMFDGKIWISDFKQKTFYPGDNYVTSKPEYRIYRLQ